MEKEKRKVKNYLQSNFLGIGFQELNDLVINKNNCVLCGTCTTLCPRIGMEGKEPRLLEYDPECSTCFRFCPKTYYPEEMFERELFSWYVDESYWPEKRDYSTFLKWFEIEHHTMVYKL